MAHGYTITADDDAGRVYKKTHDNGEVTEVSIDKVGTKEAGGVKWLVQVTDPNGSVRIGKFPVRQNARRAATEWMNNHPKGVQGPQGGPAVMNAMEEATDSIFHGGGFF